MKNALCFGGAIFGGRLDDPQALLLNLATFGLFCAASSAAYVFNDLVDREYDRRHPSKRDRPIASGAVGLTTARLLSLVLAAIAIIGAWRLDRAVLLCILFFLVTGLLYTAFLRKLALLDVLAISFGFVLRLIAGIYVLNDLPTSWIVLCTFFLALLLGFGKRRAELSRVAEAKTPQRFVLTKYTVHFLDTLVSTAAVMAIMSYALFTVTSGKNPTLVVTLPMVYYAVLHYQRLVMVRQAGEDPTRLLLKEWRIPFCVLLWLISYVAVTYWNLQLFR